MATKNSEKKIDNLREDDIIPNQRFVCLSFVSPEGIRNCNMRALKIRGCFPTHAEAAEHAKKLQEIDPDFDIFVGEVGKWLPWNPDPNTAGDQQYAEEELNKLMSEHKKNQEKAATMERERREDMIKKGQQTYTNNRQGNVDKIRDRLRKKAADNKKAKNSREEELMQKAKSLDIDLEKVEEVRETLKESQMNVQTKKEEKNETLKRLEELKKLQQKNQELRKNM